MSIRNGLKAALILCATHAQAASWPSAAATAEIDEPILAFNVTVDKCGADHRVREGKIDALTPYQGGFVKLLTVVYTGGVGRIRDVTTKLKFDPNRLAAQAENIGKKKCEEHDKRPYHLGPQSRGPILRP